jgi:ribosomal protein S18 acetylase RimI-like enzyme
VDVSLSFRDLQAIDLDELDWTGGPAHQRLLAQYAERSWTGDLELTVAEVASGRLIALGGVRFDVASDAGELWMLVVHDAWRDLGVGSALIAELEDRVRARGRRWAQLNVEHDNVRAANLYRRLGYREVGSHPEHWPADDGREYVTVSTLMRRSLD